MQMYMSQISIRRTVNTGNYENFTIEITAVLEPNDPFHDSMEKLRDVVAAECEFTKTDIMGRRTTRVQ